MRIKLTLLSYPTLKSKIFCELIDLRVWALSLRYIRSNPNYICYPRISNKIILKYDITIFSLCCFSLIVNIHGEVRLVYLGEILSPWLIEWNTVIWISFISQHSCLWSPYTPSNSFPIFWALRNYKIFWGIVGAKFLFTEPFPKVWKQPIITGV